MMTAGPDGEVPATDPDSRWVMFWRGRMRPVTAMLGRNNQMTGDPQAAGAATLYIAPEFDLPGGFEAVQVSPGDIVLNCQPRRTIFKDWTRVA